MLLKRVALVLLSFAVSLVGLEVALRAAFARARPALHEMVPATAKANAPYPKVLYTAHPFYPYMLRPFVRVWMNPIRESRPGTAREQWVNVRINSLGGRGDEVVVDGERS